MPYKSILFTGVLLFLCVVPLRAQDLVYAEYFLNADPGRGNGTPIPITPAADVTLTFTADVAALSDGFHTLYVRARDADGRWTPTQPRSFLKQSGAMPDVTALEYYIDSDPGRGNGTPVPVSADADVEQPFVADLSGLADGHHTLYVRARDAEGRWSLVTARPFYKETTPPATTITDVRYTVTHGGEVLAEERLDAFTPAANVEADFLLDPSYLEVGDGYALQVVARDEQGRRSPLVQHAFSVTTNGFPIVASPLPDLALDAGFGSVEVGDLADVFDDPDLPDDDLSFRATVSNDLLEATLEGSMLTIASTSAADGTVTVTAIAEDASGARAESAFTVTVGTGVDAEDPAEVPAAFSLAQNYPNPFNPSTTIAYALPTASHVTLRVYDVLGRAVVTLVDGQQAAGRHEVAFQAGDLPSGLYLYQVQAGAHRAVKTMLLVK